MFVQLMNVLVSIGKTISNINFVCEKWYEMLI